MFSSACGSQFAASRQRETMLLLGIVSCVLLISRCSALDSYVLCAQQDFRVNCTSLCLEHVPIIFNPRLQELTLRNSCISQLGTSRPLEVYTRLLYLDLSQNSLPRIPDETFHSQKGSPLKVLNLSANALSYVTKQPFQTLQSLETLLLANNQINETSGESFAPLSKLKILSLRHNRLTKVPIDVLYELSRLEQLDLGGNLFQVIERDSFPLTRLVSLDLSHNMDLKAIRDGALSGASNLHQLILSHNPQLLLENNNVFDGLSKLQVLNLSFNKMLTYLHPELFAVTRDLRFLSLQSCSLSVIDARITNLAPNLQFLDIRDNSLTCNCSVQWIRNHFLTQRNHSISSSSSSSSEQSVGTTVLAAAVVAALPNYQSAGETEPSSTSHSPLSESLTEMAYMFRDEDGPRLILDPVPATTPKPRPVLLPLQEEMGEQMRAEMTANAVQLLLRELEEARCSDLLKDNRLIDLGPEMTGCYKSVTESMAPIVIVALVVGVAVGVIIILVVRFRGRLTQCLSFRREGKKKRKHPYDPTRSSFLPSPISVSSTKFNPTPVTTLHVNNNRKVFHGCDPLITGTTKISNQRSLARMPFDEFGSLSSKPEFIFVHNTINTMRGNNHNNSSSSGDFGNGDATGSAASDFIPPIYRPRHVINNLRNNPYEVVPIVPPVASHPSSHRNWSHHMLQQQQQHAVQQQQLPYHLQTQHFDPDDPFNFYERTYEEAECPLNHVTPSTEL